MELTYSQINIDAYVARYMDENGCNFEEACRELEIDPTEVFCQLTPEEKY
jgi:hypothetical protein